MKILIKSNKNNHNSNIRIYSFFNLIKKFLLIPIFLLFMPFIILKVMGLPITMQSYSYIQISLYDDIVK